MDICSECFAEEENLLRLTQKYLRENKSASATQLLDDLNEEGHEVTHFLLEKWVREKRINLKQESEDGDVVGRCPYCNRELKEGQKICSTCQIKRVINSKDKMQPSREPESQPEQETEKKPRAGMYYKRRQ
jgi:hypothetical protein